MCARFSAKFRLMVCCWLSCKLRIPGFVCRASSFCKMSCRGHLGRTTETVDFGTFAFTFDVCLEDIRSEYCTALRVCYKRQRVFAQHYPAECGSPTRGPTGGYGGARYCKKAKPVADDMLLNADSVTPFYFTTAWRSSTTHA